MQFRAPGGRGTAKGLARLVIHVNRWSADFQAAVHSVGSLVAGCFARCPQPVSSACDGRSHGGHRVVAILP
eukprot:500851-Pyramimonas_sp.AAC.1